MVGASCCGCMACEAVCPVHAIELDTRGGYWYPKINACVYCGKCLDVCPILNSEHNKVKEKNTAYIAYLIDEQERRKSTSGGLFFAIATYVIQHDGVVYGAAFDDSMRVTHHRASTKQQVTMLRGSKYVQSDIRLFFQQIIDDLKTKKMVLFSGTPCQVSAVKSFCEKKANCDNLFLLEILCYGVPSPMIFQNHLKQIELNYKDAVCNYLFRDESGGWGQYYIHSADLKNGMHLYNETLFQDLEKLYRSHYNVRQSCFECRYIGRKRCADITIGDCWGVHEITKEFDSKDGVSLVLINTSFGREVWNSICNDVNSLEIEYNVLEKSNGVLVHGPEKPNDYEEFWKWFQKRGYLETLIRFTPYGGIRYSIYHKICNMKNRLRKKWYNEDRKSG